MSSTTDRRILAPAPQEATMIDQAQELRYRPDADIARYGREAAAVIAHLQTRIAGLERELLAALQSC